MARNKGNGTAAQTVESGGAAQGPANGNETISKQEAVRRVLDEHGYETTPTEIVKHVRQKFGLNMTTDHASTTKSVLKRKAAEAAGARGKGTQRKGGRPKKAATAVGAGAAKKAGSGNGATKISFQDILTVRELAARVGARQLQDLIKMLAK
jgi:hypothetical protein